MVDNFKIVLFEVLIIHIHNFDSFILISNYIDHNNEQVIMMIPGTEKRRVLNPFEENVTAAKLLVTLLLT